MKLLSSIILISLIMFSGFGVTKNDHLKMKRVYFEGFSFNSTDFRFTGSAFDGRYLYIIGYGSNDSTEFSVILKFDPVTQKVVKEAMLTTDGREIELYGIAANDSGVYVIGYVYGTLYLNGEPVENYRGDYFLLTLSKDLELESISRISKFFDWYEVDKLLIVGNKLIAIYHVTYSEMHKGPKISTRDEVDKSTRFDAFSSTYTYIYVIEDGKTLYDVYDTPVDEKTVGNLILISTYGYLYIYNVSSRKAQDIKLKDQDYYALYDPMIKDGKIYGVGSSGYPFEQSIYFMEIDPVTEKIENKVFINTTEVHVSVFHPLLLNVGDSFIVIAPINDKYGLNDIGIILVKGDEPVLVDTVGTDYSDYPIAAYYYDKYLVIVGNVETGTGGQGPVLQGVGGTGGIVVEYSISNPGSGNGERNPLGGLIDNNNVIYLIVLSLIPVYLGYIKRSLAGSSR